LFVEEIDVVVTNRAVTSNFLLLDHGNVMGLEYWVLRAKTAKEKSVRFAGTLGK